MENITNQDYQNFYTCALEEIQQLQEYLKQRKKERLADEEGMNYLQNKYSFLLRCLRTLQKHNRTFGEVYKGIVKEMEITEGIYSKNLETYYKEELTE